MTYTVSSGTLNSTIPYHANGRWCLVAGKVTVDMALHWPRVTGISGSPPMGSRPWRGRWAPAYALWVEYSKLYLYLYWLGECAHSLLQEVWNIAWTFTCWADQSSTWARNESRVFMNACASTRSTTVLLATASVNGVIGRYSSPLSPSIMHPLFYSRLKTRPFHKSFPP